MNLREVGMICDVVELVLLVRQQDVLEVEGVIPQRERHFLQRGSGMRPWN